MLFSDGQIELTFVKCDIVTIDCVLVLDEMQIRNYYNYMRLQF